MHYFKIAYDDAKKLAGLLYNAPYQVSAPFCEILHNLVVISDSETHTFKHYIDEERITVEKPIETSANEGNT